MIWFKRIFKYKLLYLYLVRKIIFFTPYYNFIARNKIVKLSSLFGKRPQINREVGFLSNKKP